MAKTIISLRDDKAETIIKEAKKKAIDCGLTFSDATIQLLEKWVNNVLEGLPVHERNHRRCNCVQDI